MFVYEVLFLIGAIGFGAMVVLAGFSGLGGHGHGAGHGHSVDAGAHGHGHFGGHGHAIDAGGHGHGGGHEALLGAHLKSLPNAAARGLRTAGSAGRLKSFLTLSPLDIFAMCLGAGSTALVLQHVIAHALLAGPAIVGGLILDYAIVRPLLAFAFRFASTPSEGLEESVGRSVRAVTRFDTMGRGLVKVNMDGQEFQVLAHLDPAEHEAGTLVQRDDELYILDVDAKKNTCRVTRQLST